MSGVGMYSASIPIDLTNSSLPESGAEPAVAGSPEFGQLLAVAQAAAQVTQIAAEAGAKVGVDSATLTLVSELVAPTVNTDEVVSARELPKVSVVDDPDENEPIEESAGVAAILAQLLVGSKQNAPPQADLSAEKAPVHLEKLSRDVESESDEIVTSDLEGRRKSAQDVDLSHAEAGAVNIDNTRPERLLDLGSATARTLQPTTAGSTSAQGIVQIATSVIRESSPTAAPVAPTHARLREAVGSARWADELGSRLVLMSVRGQHQGSLTLTPEHMGPVEVQISVNRDTANVWFGAQQADTRAALNDAMPRLRELLAASGLSLGQSGVSEQAPRRSFEPIEVRAGSVAQTTESAVEVATPAWRRWLPGIIDTYA